MAGARGRCFLCQGSLLPGTQNYLLQASQDHNDSLDVVNSKENTRITHLGFNLAKNKVTMAEFEDWLSVVIASPQPTRAEQIASRRISAGKRGDTQLGGGIRNK